MFYSNYIRFVCETSKNIFKKKTLKNFVILIPIKMNSIRLLFVGDECVGKTTIISLLTDEVNKEFDGIILPFEEFALNTKPEKIPTILVDYSAKEQNIDELCDEICKADVVCIVYSVDDLNTVNRLTSYWLPLIRQTSLIRKTVVLVCNKMDLINYSKYENPLEKVLDIDCDFNEVENWLACSAIEAEDVNEVLHMAHQALLYPTPPLYTFNSKQYELTPKFIQALERIFKICDLDNDGVLNEYEMNNFVSRSFDTKLLHHQKFESLKEVIRINFCSTIYETGFTLKAFKYFHMLFIPRFMQRRRNEAIWSILHQFGYDNDVNMSKEFTHPIIDIPPEATIEISQSGQQFLTDLFYRSDLDGDLALSPKEYKAVFSACPRLPWTSNLMRSVPATQNGYLSYSSWMCLWNLMIIVDVVKTLEYLAYLGFNFHQEKSQLFAINITKKETTIKLNCEKQSNKSVFKCNVIGGKGSGKTALCRGLITKEMKTLADKDFGKDITHCINTIHLYDHERYIVLHDINVDPFDSLEPEHLDCDVACLIYDSNNSKSFEYIAKMYIKHFTESSCPILIVGTKHDLRGAVQDYILQPHDFCDKYQLIPPQHFSVKENCKEIYSKLTTMAAFRPLKQNWKSHLPRKHHKNFFGLTGLGIAAATIIGFILLKSLVN